MSEGNVSSLEVFCCLTIHFSFHALLNKRLICDSMVMQKQDSVEPAYPCSLIRAATVQHLECTKLYHARESLSSNSTVITCWLQSTRAQNCVSGLAGIKRRKYVCQYFTSENILC